MKTLLAALALVTLATACDPETATPSDESTFREGEVIVPPTGPIGTGFIGKGGYDNPIDILMDGYDLAAPEYQDAFHQEVEAQALEAIQEEFLGNERNLAECPWICEDMKMSWNEGVYVEHLEVEYGEVLTETGEEKEGLHWTTVAEARADVGCGCI